jgi:hypothetical protein
VGRIIVTCTRRRLQLDLFALAFRHDSLLLRPYPLAKSWLLRLEDLKKINRPPDREPGLHHERIP